MNALRRKLRSDRGASITFALLLFLVCALACSVIIVAATAAGGRMSQLPQTDQRYYAVTSAQELLCQEMLGKAVTVVCDSTDPSSPTYEIEKITEADNAAMVYDKTKLPLLDSASTELVKVLNSKTTESRIMALTSGLGDKALNCEIIENLRSDGLLVFDVANASTSDATGRRNTQYDSDKRIHYFLDTNRNIYELRITFASNVRKLATGDPDIEKWIISWKLHSIEKVRVDRVNVS